MGEEELKFRHALSAVFLFLGVALGLAFMSPTITGNAIGNLSNGTSTGIGIIIFIAGVSIGFLLSRD